MIRKIIHIDEEKCNGCGICAEACHEGAIEIIGGKAKLTREDYCDGFGDCLPGCPTGAISFEEREAPEYDKEAVIANKLKKIRENATKPTAGECPVGTALRDAPDGAPAHAEMLARFQAKMPAGGCPGSRMATFDTDDEPQEQPAYARAQRSQLRQWPCQIKLVPVNAPYFDGAKLLIAADCTAYAYANIHQEFMRGRITLIGCPKLDGIDYTQKLTDIIARNDIRELVILRMEVPCCGGLERAATTALKNSGKFIPWRVVVITTDGHIKD